MNNRRNAVLGLLTLITFVICGALASAEAQEVDTDNKSANIDFDGFLGLIGELGEYRKDRLVDLATFNEMKADPKTILLDTRSAEAFMLGHIDGAVNLNFSDFTDEKLAAVIGDKDTRILIYCNNNFSDNIAPVMLKRVELALNVPTFINLYGYGYENIYELGETVSIHDEAVEWYERPAGSAVQKN
jgi:hypothetical protein